MRPNRLDKLLIMKEKYSLAVEAVPCERFYPPEFPANREKYREFFLFCPKFQPEDPSTALNQKGFLIPCLNWALHGTGNYYGRNRELSRGNRELSARIRETTFP